MRAETMRAMESVGPPAENATTSDTGRDGKGCATALSAPHSKAAKRIPLDIFMPSPFFEPRRSVSANRDKFLS